MMKTRVHIPELRSMIRWKTACSTKTCLRRCARSRPRCRPRRWWPSEQSVSACSPRWARAACRTRDALMARIALVLSCVSAAAQESGSECSVDRIARPRAGPAHVARGACVRAGVARATQGNLNGERESTQRASTLNAGAARWGAHGPQEFSWSFQETFQGIKSQLLPCINVHRHTSSDP